MSANPNTASLRVATANLDGWHPQQADKVAVEWNKLRLDLVCAQELTASRFAALCSALGPAWWGVHSLDVADRAFRSGRHWGVAIFGRAATVERDGDIAVIGDPADDSGSGLFWRRTLRIPVRAGDKRLHVMSVHVRPGAVVGPQKLEFLAHLRSWITCSPRPLVLGVDTNCAGFYEKDEEYWETAQPDLASESELWGDTPAHDLRDTWRILGKGHSFTHRLRNGNRGRFDQIWISEPLDALDATHEHAAADRYSSDHALVTAVLTL